MLKPCKIEDIPNDKTEYGKNVRLIHEFIESGELAAEVVLSPDENSRNKCACLFNTNKRLGNPVIITNRRGRIFLIKKEAE